MSINTNIRTPAPPPPPAAPPILLETVIPRLFIEVMNPDNPLVLHNLNLRDPIDPERLQRGIEAYRRGDLHPNAIAQIRNLITELLRYPIGHRITEADLLQALPQVVVVDIRVLNRQ